MSTAKVGKVTITTNVDLLLGDLAQAMGLPSRIWGSIYSELEYAIYTEFGTAYMLPHAMFRNSMPAIEQKFEEVWRALPNFPPTEDDLKKLINDVVAFGLEEVKNRTHVDSGDLKKSIEKEEAQSA